MQPLQTYNVLYKILYIIIHTAVPFHIVFDVNMDYGPYGCLYQMTRV